MYLWAAAASASANEVSIIGRILPLCQQRQPALLEALRDGNFILQGLTPHDGADDVQALTQDQPQIRLDLGATHEPYQHQAATDLEALQVALPVGSSNKILHQFDARAVVRSRTRAAKSSVL